MRLSHEAATRSASKQALQKRLELTNLEAVILVDDCREEGDVDQSVRRSGTATERDEDTEATPKSLAALAVREAELVPESRVVLKLALPHVCKGVEDGRGKVQAMGELGEEVAL